MTWVLKQPADGFELKRSFAAVDPSYESDDYNMEVSGERIEETLPGNYRCGSFFFVFFFLRPPER